jgi:hypothetical protein
MFIQHKPTSLGSFAGKDMRLINGGPRDVPQGLQGGLPGRGGGLMRLMQQYGMPQQMGGPRRPFFTGQM